MEQAMTVTQCEMALDTVIQQTWKRVREPAEIRSFLDRREAMLMEADSEEL